MKCDNCINDPIECGLTPDLGNNCKGFQQGPESPVKPLPEKKPRWTKEKIQAGLKADDTWVIRAIAKLYELQTEDEKMSEDTKHTNGVGFTAFDAEILSSFAKQIKAWDKVKYRMPLSEKQMVIARKRVLKYAGQLAKIANGMVAC